MAPATDWRAVTTLGAARTARRPAGARRAAGMTSSTRKRKSHRDHLGQDRGQAGVDVAGQVADAVLGDQPEGEGTHEGHGQAAQAARPRRRRSRSGPAG